ncbi:1-acyl-sn-glycerol-3-phosphate acyltransferase [Acinetobacter sp. ANC 4641]|uniref:1-acyl-sn-glycerol-3-phosphate acyltransferase n=1 Tax=Acinetobacter sp. ANC 4641 TaxID=2529847 RepID=UPI00103FB141|nr:1-acyl-sn-glycerol-3-phosphate acyltransferase [Acinetobacter sp. ANC 4641]TCB08106.1 acyltransferase [Acinetobacter sp. ANC 4641]
MKKQLGKLAFKLSGWTYHLQGSILEDKQVIIGFEHTSMLDGVLSWSLFQILGLQTHTLVKKELFKGPVAPLLKAMGAIPVDRKAKQDIVSQMVQLFQSHTKFNLVIAPEATRAKNGEPRKPIRTGFWHIAKAANVPIVLMYANPKTKQGGIIGKIYPHDFDQDMQTIKDMYKKLAGLDIVIPEAKNT